MKYSLNVMDITYMCENKLAKFFVAYVLQNATIKILTSSFYKP